MQGSFRTSPGDELDRLRTERLCGQAEVAQVAAGWNRLFLREHREVFVKAVEEEGLLVVDFDEPLDLEEFLTFGRELGEPLEEDHLPEGVNHYSSGVLEIANHWGNTDDPAKQPFSSTWITLHCEFSRASAADQPRYLLFQAVAANQSGDSGLTVTAAMKEVLDTLPETSRAVLAATRYARYPDAPPFLMKRGNLSAFNFRDFGAEPLKWRYTGSPTTAENVNQAIHNLLMAMYRARWTTIAWKRGRVAILDNWRVFHGRTRLADGNRSRVLHRLCLR